MGNNHITFAQLTDTLKSAGEAYHIMALQNDVRLVVSQRGGRVFGPFLPRDDAESLTWINESLALGRGYLLHPAHLRCVFSLVQQPRLSRLHENN